MSSAPPTEKALLQERPSEYLHMSDSSPRKPSAQSANKSQASIRFSYPEKESAVMGYVLNHGFKGFPASLPAASAFASDYRTVWAAALAVNAAGREVSQFTINDEIRRLGLDKEMGDCFSQGWESWSFLADQSLLFNHAAVVECLKDIEAAALERVAHDVLAKGAEGIIDRVEVLERLKGIEEQSQTESLGSILAARAFDIKNPPPPAEARFMMREQMIASPGNLQVISAKSKHGKSGAITGALAATFSQSGDTLGFLSTNPRDHAVIHFDTEQSPADHHRCILTAMVRVRAGKVPPWLRSYRIVDRPMRERFDLLEHELRVANKVHGGIHSVFIDGVADFIADPNDPEEAFAAVERLHRLAVQYNTAIFCVLHINPSSENGKTRGHLGSQLERKAETNLALEKDEHGITTIFTTNSRHASISKQDGPRFRWDVDKDMHVSCESMAETRQAENADKLIAIRDDVFLAGDAIRYVLAVQKIEKFAQVKKARAEGLFTEMKRAGLIVKDAAGFWGATA